MDTSSQIPGKDEPGMSQDEAVKILNSAQIEDVIREAHLGNLDPIKMFNAANVVLGGDPLDMSEFVQ